MTMHAIAIIVPRGAPGDAVARAARPAGSAHAAHGPWQVRDVA